MRQALRCSLATALAVLVGAGCGNTHHRAAPARAAAAHQQIGFMVVEKSGVTEQADGAGGYGVVIENPTDRDALGVSLHIDLFDARSHVVATQTRFMVLMPADNAYYVGGSFTSDSDPVTRVSVDGTIDRTIPYRYALPNVTMVRIVRQRDGSDTATGSVANDVGYTLSRDDPVDVVYFDARGRVVGGTRGVLGQALADTETETFRVPMRLAARVNSIQATVGAVAVPERKPPTPAETNPV